MRIRVVAVGKLRDRDLQARCEAYVKRSRAMLPFTRESYRDNATAIAKATGGHLILLDERGEHLTSAALAAWLGDLRDTGIKDLAFVIGDAHGFAPSARDMADKVLSLSAMTLPHQLAQLLLCEQLYRAGTILSGHPYHH